MLGGRAGRPTGQSIAFDSRVTGQPAVYVVAADGGTPRLLADDGYLPSWSGAWPLDLLRLRPLRPPGGVENAGRRGPAIQVTRNGGAMGA